MSNSFSSRLSSVVSRLGCWLVFLPLLGGGLALGYALFLVITQPRVQAGEIVDLIRVGVVLVLLAFADLVYWFFRFLLRVLPKADTTPAIQVDEEAFHALVAALEQHPALEIRYPGALLLAEFHTHPRRREEAEGPGGRTHYRGAIFVQRYFGFLAPVPPEHTPQAVLAWYQEQFEAQGWEKVESDDLARTLHLKAMLCLRQPDYRLDVSVFERLSMSFGDTTTYPLLFDMSLKSSSNLLWGWET